MANTVGSVRNFYKGANVLMTGGSGFVGKVLVEHLLRKTDVNSIYIIIRAKKGQSPEERSKNYFSNVMFNILKEENINALDKVKFLPGDIEQENLGLSVEDKTFLVENTNIVFHIAATVAFNENLKKAIAINIGGTKIMLDMAENMKNLKVFMHVSTAFVNVHLEEDCCPEEIRPKNGDLGPLELLELSKCIDENTADKLTPFFVGKNSNSYLFTKRGAESLVGLYKNLPIGIFRPAVVLSTKSEPTPGWIENLYGPTGILMAMASGLIHLLLTKSKSSADIVPVDMTINCLIASAWEVHNRHNGLCNGEMGIYNYVSSPDAHITWRKFVFEVQDRMQKFPPVNRFWHSFQFTTPSPTFYLFLSFILQYIPALIYDKIMSFMGEKPRMVNTVKKVDQLNDFFRPLLLKEWKYTNDNVHGLWDRMDPFEKAVFPFNLKNFSWDSYLNNYVQGINIYLFKTPCNKLEGARETARKYFWLHWGIISSLVVFSFWGTFKLMCNSVLNYVYSI